LSDTLHLLCHDFLIKLLVWFYLSNGTGHEIATEKILDYNAELR